MPSTLYERMRDTAKRLTERNNTGTVIVKRPTGTLPDPDAAYDPVFEMDYSRWLLDSVVIGVIAEYVDGSVISADDLMVITSPIAQPLDEAEDPVGAEAVVEFNSTSDEVFIDGRRHEVCKIERIPAAGTASGFFIFVKS